MLVAVTADVLMILNPFQRSSVTRSRTCPVSVRHDDVVRPARRVGRSHPSLTSIPLLFKAPLLSLTARSPSALYYCLKELAAPEAAFPRTQENKTNPISPRPGRLCYDGTLRTPRRRATSHERRATKTMPEKTYDHAPIELK